ncbi:MAG: hypothetical protein J0M12_05345 [Deltaproteobacteria bacterium]|nr:hypothetical protein [Deltaproteobacteria bacterium]
MRLTDLEIKTIARQSGAGEKAIFRLLGNVRIPLPKPPSDDESEQAPSKRRELDVGLRLQSAEILAPVTLSIGRKELLERLSKILREYFNACPNICAWVGRGDFKPEKIPDQVTKGMLLHACRTAGRLRAKAIRC